MYLFLFSMTFQGIFENKPLLSDKNKNFSSDHGLQDYQIGSMIAKGCNAAVYEAKYKAFKTEGDTQFAKIIDIINDKQQYPLIFLLFSIYHFTILSMLILLNNNNNIVVVHSLEPMELDSDQDLNDGSETESNTEIISLPESDIDQLEDDNLDSSYLFVPNQVYNKSTSIFF